MKIDYEEVNKYNAKYILKNMKDLTKEEQESIERFRKEFVQDHNKGEERFLRGLFIEEFESFLLSEIRTAVERAKEEYKNEIFETVDCLGMSEDVYKKEAEGFNKAIEMVKYILK